MQGLRALLSELLERRELLFLFVYREIQIKYKQSVMGFLWAIFMPMLVVSAGVLVRYGYAFVANRPFVLADIASVAVKSIPWAFVVASIRFSSTSLISNRNLVTKIYFPRAIFPLAAVLSQGADFLVASAVLVVVLALAGVGVSVHLVAVPLLITILVALVTGIGIITSAASLFFRDVKYLVEVFLTFAIFFTPVFYEPEMFGRFASLLMLNPFAPVLEGLRDCVVVHTWPSWALIGYSAGWALLLLGGGLALFRRLEPAFAECI